MPVRSTLGWHLIKLLEVEAPKVPSFFSMKDKLSLDLKTRQAEQLFVKAIKQLEYTVFEAFDLSQPAYDLNLTVHTSLPFGREGGEGITGNHTVVTAAFSPEVLDEGANSSPIALDPETFVVLRSKEHLKPIQLPLERVSTVIRAQMTKDRASLAAKTHSDELVYSLREGKDPLKKLWKLTKTATRHQESIDLEVLKALFRMPKPVSKSKPTFTTVTLADGSLMIVRLDGINEASEPTDEEKSLYQDVLSSRIRSQDFAAYRKQLEFQGDIKKF